MFPPPHTHETKNCWKLWTNNGPVRNLGFRTVGSPSLSIFSVRNKFHQALGLGKGTSPWDDESRWLPIHWVANPRGCDLSSLLNLFSCQDIYYISPQFYISIFFKTHWIGKVTFSNLTLAMLQCCLCSRIWIIFCLWSWPLIGCESKELVGTGESNKRIPQAGWKRTLTITLNFPQTEIPPRGV